MPCGCPQWPEEGIWSAGAGVKNSQVAWHMLGKSVGPLEEQQGLLTAQASLQPPLSSSYEHNSHWIGFYVNDLILDVITISKPYLQI